MPSDKNTVLITGANKGIGFEFARQYAAKGWQVIACARNPEQADNLKALAGEYPEVRIETLDVMDLDAIDALAGKLRDQPIDVLINNAGIFGDFADQAFGGLKLDQFDIFMQTNCRGPLKMSEAFLEHVKASRQKKIMAITSQAGSFGLDSGGLPSQYFYKSSKAALNMCMRNVAKDVKEHGVTVGILSPGMVAKPDTPPERRFPGLIDPSESIEGMIRVIDDLTIDDSGCFIRYNGEIQPW